jgi:two-component system phosphate regulon response regulator OmpR
MSAKWSAKMTTAQVRKTGIDLKQLTDATVLVVDDDVRFREELCEYLREHGMCVESAGDVSGARNRLAAGSYDLVLLDLWLGRENGFDFLRELRKTREIPCIMMTAQDDVTDKIVGLELGADDYLFKPVNMRELLARARSLLRRAETSTAQNGMAMENASEIARAAVGGWHFDVMRRSLSAPDGRIVPLTTAECDLLTELVANEGRPLSRTDLSRRVFNRHWHPFDRGLDGLVVKLRRKLEPDLDNPRVIKTVRGRGYVFTGFSS